MPKRCQNSALHGTLAPVTGPMKVISVLCLTGSDAGCDDLTYVNVPIKTFPSMLRMLLEAQEEAQEDETAASALGPSSVGGYLLEWEHMAEAVDWAAGVIGGVDNVKLRKILEVLGLESGHGEGWLDKNMNKVKRALGEYFYEFFTSEKLKGKGVVDCAVRITATIVINLSNWEEAEGDEMSDDEDEGEEEDEDEEDEEEHFDREELDDELDEEEEDGNH